ncbi:MAG: response regulator [Sphingomonadales bacterium]
MTLYDLERFSVLLVEDSPFMRSMMLNALKVLGVGTVTTLEDGGRAIDFLHLVHSNPMRAGVQTVDIIVSNWEMSPVDGMMLLRWVRRHKDSEDRFIPFIMVSGHSETNRVQQARDLGVTEFLCKPFSIKALGEKLLSVIDRPRQFVHTKDYFGPDRRRTDLPFEGPEKRKLTDESEDVEIVHG